MRRTEALGTAAWLGSTTTPRIGSGNWAKRIEVGKNRLAKQRKTAPMETRITPPVPRRGCDFRKRSFKQDRTGTTGLQENGTKIPEAGLPCSPSREGSLIQLLAGLLTLVSTDWPPSRPLRLRFISKRRPRDQWHSGQPSTITVAGPCRILTGFPIKLPKAPEANCSSRIRWAKKK